jgi:hypothetical protein
MALYYAIDRVHLFRSELEIRLVTLVIVPGLRATLKLWARTDSRPRRPEVGF